jgi:hypothetical protein
VAFLCAWIFALCVAHQAMDAVMYRLSPKAGGEEALGVEFVIRGYSSAEPMEEQWDLDVEFA